MMNQANQCPQCDHLLTQVGEFWICPNHGDVSFIDLPNAALRIFLSYGHDGNEELVRRIKSDLERRGHDVWFDQSEIKTGHDWRHSITKGILDSHQVLSFLSKHSIRDPGVCLDEIAISVGVKGGNIQTILVESEQEVKPPPSISHIQWLDMNNWKEQRDAGETTWESWYQEKFSEIVTVVESDESRRFAGEIETLAKRLKPISSDTRIFELISKGLVGRTWLVDEIEKWRNSDQKSKLFCLMGAPGVGKSAFAAHLAHYGRDKVIAYQFCQHDKPAHRDAHRIVRSLAFQIATRLPDYRKLLVTLSDDGGLDQLSPAELFDYLLAEPLHWAIDGSRERHLIVIDALDEAGEIGSNELVKLLAGHASSLPDWIRIIVTSRRESDVVKPLEKMNPLVFDTASEANLTDIREYLQSELAPFLQKCAEADSIVEDILDKSEGVFLYAERFCDEVQQGYRSLDSPKGFPKGLGGIYFSYFNRQFSDQEQFKKEVRPLLSVISAAQGPLPIKMLATTLGMDLNLLRQDWLPKLGSLFPVQKQNTVHGGEHTIRSFHKSVGDWLVEIDEATGQFKAGQYAIDLKLGNQFLANACLQECQINPEKMSEYALAHLPDHLTISEMWGHLQIVIFQQSPGYLMKWTEHGEGSQGRYCLEQLLKSEALAEETAAGLASQLARICSYQGDYREGGDWIQYCLDRASGVNSRRIRAVATHEQASLHLYQDDFRSAKEKYRKALRMCVWQRPAYADEAAANLIGLATVYLAELRFKKAVKFAQKSLRYLRDTSDEPHEVAALRIIASASVSTGQHALAKSTLATAIRLSRKANLNQELTRLLLTLGRLHYDEEVWSKVNPTKAAKLFRKAIEAAQKSGNLYGQIEGVMSLGLCAFANRDLNLGVSCFQRAGGYRLTQDHAELLSWWRLGLGSAAQQAKDFQGADELYSECSKIAEEHQIGYWHAKGLVGRGAVSWHSGRTGEADDFWRQACRAARTVSPYTHQKSQRNIEQCREDDWVTPS